MSDGCSKEGRLPNILILGTQVPFTRGGAEELIDSLRFELFSRGYQVDVIRLPFSALPKEEILREMALWRALNLSEFAGRKVDLVIPTKFPSYLVKHSNKVPWLVHQHRQAYELFGTRFGDFGTEVTDEALRQEIIAADSLALAESKKIFTISPNVSDRLENYLGLGSMPLLPPLPFGSRYRRGGKGRYILSVGRLCSIKRSDLIIKALPLIDESLSLKIVGAADEPGIDEYLRSEIDKHHLWHRVEFLGRVAEEKLIELYAEAFAVYYAPFDEDYGFVTLEAFESAKPVVTAWDSGCVLSFVRNLENGLVSEATEAGIAAAFNKLLSSDSLYRRLSDAAYESRLNNSWDEIISALVS